MCGKYAKEQRNQVVGKYFFTVCRLADLTVCQESEIKRGKVCHVFLFLFQIPNFLHLTPAAIKKHCEALKRKFIFYLFS